MNALQIAEKIFANGRIEDPEDWSEMKIELELEFNECGITGEERDNALKIVKARWYSDPEGE